MRIRRSLLVRALALMLAVFMLLFACLFALLYRSARDTVRTQELQNVSTRLEMFRAYLDLSLDNGRNTVYQFMQSGLMSSDEQDKIQAYFQRYSETNSVISVKFLLEGDRVLAIDQPLLLNSMTADSAFFYSQAQHNRLVISAPYYSPLAAGRVVALIRSIPGNEDRPERLLVMEIRTSNLIGTMSEKLSRQEAVVLLTAQGDTVYINFYAGVLGHLVSRNGQLELGDTLRQSLRGMPQGVEEIELDNRSILVQCSRYSSQWSIYYLISAEEFYARINAAIRQYIMLFAIGTLLLLLGEALVILSLLRPVNQLARQVDALPVDKPGALLPVRRSDEIGRLAASFNSLLTRLRLADTKKAEAERNYFQMEYKALQSQIQPHFLFNTLLCVSACLQQGKTEEAQRLLSDLDALLRASTDKYGEAWTLRDEMALLSRYVGIQQTRYGNCFDVITGDYAPYGDYLLPKLLLQPIVENAIYHGMAALGRRGEIRIRFEPLEDGMLDILIEDSGRGMTREQVEKIFSDTEKNAVKNDGRGMVSIGLQNVRQRIEQFYGPGCSLYVRSREGIGTTVEVIIRNKQKPDSASMQEG